ncbi:MAG: hypothetical protein ABSH12_09065 [Endomicrobiales bacterium]|jgi:hypothetical protein
MDIRQRGGTIQTFSVSLVKELDVTIYSFEGNTTYGDIHDAITQYFKGPQTRYTMWDLSEALFKRDLTRQEIQQLARYGNELGRPQKRRCDLIIVPVLLTYGMARMYAAYADLINDDTEAFKTLIFRTRDAGLSWVKDKELLHKKRDNDR